MLRVHTFFRCAHEENKERIRIAQIEQVPASTVIEFEDIGPLTQPQAKAKFEDNREFYSKTAERITTRLGILAKVQLWLFIAGIVLVAAARACAGFAVTCMQSIG